MAVGKYWVTKRGPNVAAEALECLGGNGYVEESGMPRLYREAPLNSVWEGSGNVNALDVLRALGKEPASVEAFFAEIALAEGLDPRLDDAVTGLRAGLADLDGDRGRVPGGWWSGWPWCCRAPCWSDMRRRRWPRRSARAGSRATGGTRSALCRAGWTWRRLWTARSLRPSG